MLWAQTSVLTSSHKLAELEDELISVPKEPRTSDLTAVRDTLHQPKALEHLLLKLCEVMGAVESLSDLVDVEG